VSRRRVSEESKEQSPLEKACLTREAGGAGAAAGGYLQAVSHGSHLRGGAAFPLAFHRFLLAGSKSRGQKGSVNTPQTQTRVPKPPLPPARCHPAALGTESLWEGERCVAARAGQEMSFCRDKAVLHRRSGSARRPYVSLWVCSPRATTFVYKAAGGGIYR